MSGRCYVMLYEKLDNLDFKLIVPIKSTKVGSAYAGMPQFFGGGAIHDENHLETIERELYEESFGHLKLKDKAKLDIIHSNTLEKSSLKINFYFYITTDFTSDFDSLPVVFSETGEMSSIEEFRPQSSKKSTSYNVCKTFNITPTEHFEKSETYKALDLVFKKLTEEI